MCIISQYIWISKFCLIYPISPFYFHWLYCIAQLLRHVPTLCNPMDCSPPGSSSHGIFQARTLQWGAISYSRESSWLRDQTWVSCISCISRRVFTAGLPGMSYLSYFPVLFSLSTGFIVKHQSCHQLSFIISIFRVFSFTVWEIYLNVHTLVCI